MSDAEEDTQELLNIATHTRARGDEDDIEEDYEALSPLQIVERIKQVGDNITALLLLIYYYIT